MHSDNDSLPVRQLIPLKSIVLLIIGAMLPFIGAYISQAIEARQIEDLKLSVQQKVELTTLEVDVGTIDVDVQLKHSGICEYHASYSMTGKIKAGVDLTNSENISIFRNATDRSLSMTLPSARILGCQFNEPFEYHVINQFCNGNSNDVAAITQYSTQQRIMEQAQNGDILLAAEDATVAMMGNLIETVTSEPVTISFSNPIEDATLPDSCRPLMPEGWKLENDIWYPD